MSPIPRAENVGSLLRPDALREANRALRRGTTEAETVRQLEDAAVLDAIELQESVGLDVITDGEMRRVSWIATARGPLDGFALLPGGPGWEWKGTETAERWSGYLFPFVTGRLSIRSNLADTEYAFLREHATARTKLSFPAPSFHRTNWHPEHSKSAYPRCDDFLIEMRDYLRQVARRAVELGCDYVQLDAPNYGNLCDPEHRQRMEAQGRDLDAELEFDAALDNSIFDGISGVTRAMHLCRGNAAGNWAASGGYERIAADLFPRLELDVLLLEYDTDRSGDFGPLAHVRANTVAVLGLISTKLGALEDADSLEARIHEAAQIKPLEQLAVSPQCGFASVEGGNPITPSEQRAKLELVREIARRVWGESP